MGHNVQVIYTRTLLDHIEVPPDTIYEVHWAGFFAIHSKNSSPFRPLNAVTVARKAAKLSRGHDNVVVHSQGEEGTLIPRLLPHLRWILSPRYPNYPAILLTKQPKLFGLAIRWLVGTKYMLLRKFARQADLVCPTSIATGKTIETALCLPPEKIRIVPNGIQKEFLETKRIEPVDDAPVVFFGRIERESKTHY